MADKKPQLHYSHIDCGLNCAHKYYLEYLMQGTGWIGIDLPIGTAVHKAVADNLRQKSRTGKNMAILKVETAARDCMVGQLDNLDIRLTAEQNLLGRKRTIGRAIDLTVTLARLHCRDIAPGIRPYYADHVERKMVLECPNYPFDVSMTIDCLSEHSQVRECKTSKPGRWNQVNADTSLQLTIYALAVHLVDGIYSPIDCTIDNLVKSKVAKAKVIHTTRGPDQFKYFFNLLEVFAEMLEKGVYPPANPTWWGCSKSWCKFANSDPPCRYWSGRP